MVYTRSGMSLGKAKGRGRGERGRERGREGGRGAERKEGVRGGTFLCALVTKSIREEAIPAQAAAWDPCGSAANWEPIAADAATDSGAVLVVHCCRFLTG